MASRALLTSFAVALASLGGQTSVECFSPQQSKPYLSMPLSPQPTQPSLVGTQGRSPSDQATDSLPFATPTSCSNRRAGSRCQNHNSSTRRYISSSADSATSSFRRVLRKRKVNQREGVPKLQAAASIFESTTRSKPLKRVGNKKVRKRQSADQDLLGREARLDKQPKSRRGEGSFYRKFMLEHDILTKEEEQELGHAVRRARHCQELIRGVVEERQQQQDSSTPLLPARGGRPKGFRPPLLPLQRTSDSVFASTTDSQQKNTWCHSDDEDDFDELQNLSIYGLAQLETAPLDNWSFSGGASIPPVRQSGEQRPDDWDINVAALESLQNQDMEEVLGLKGGRAELQTILLEGAMARDTLIRSNIRLVVSIAKKWARRQHRESYSETLRSVYDGSWDRPSLDEAIQEGILGLAKAVDRFEPKRDLKFGTYATFWITSYVRRCFQGALTTALRVPPNHHELKSKYKALVKSYYSAGHEIPSLDKLADALGVSTARLDNVLKVTQTLASTDARVFSGPTTLAGKAGNDVTATTLLGDLLVDETARPEEDVELSFLRQSLENAMASELVPYERDIVRLRLGLDDGVVRTVRQICQVYGGAVTQAEVRSAEARAFKKLRSPQSLSTFKLLAYCDFAGIDQEEALARSR